MPGAGLGLVNLAGGEVRQSGQVALADQAAVVNEGLWVLVTRRRHRHGGVGWCGGAVRQHGHVAVDVERHSRSVRVW